MSTQEQTFNKENSLNDLRSSIEFLALENNLADEEFFDSLKGDEKEIYAALYAPIELESQPFDENLLSPTPGDPYNVKTHSMSYYHAAEMLMLGRFKNRADLITNSDTADVHTIMMGLDAIELEIITQHEHQCRRNNESTNRLQASFRHNTARFDPGMADVIRDVRSGVASTEERIALLIQHPEMDSIEDMKFTCPLDIKGYKSAMERYFRNFMELQHKSVIDFTIIPKDEQEITTKDVTESAGKGIEVCKTVLFEVTIDDVVLELVERKSFCVFPTSPQIRGITENIVKLTGKHPANRQPINVSAYFRVKRHRDDESDESLPLLFDSAKLHLIKDGRAQDPATLKD